MATQTGSISFEAVGGFSAYASGQFTTTEDVAQMSQPNLSPYFSHPLTDVYDADENPDGYWRENRTDFWTNLTDGWGHVERVNSGSSGAWCNFYVFPVPNGLKPDTKYTFLVEWRNAVISGTGPQIAPTTVLASQPDCFVGAAYSPRITDGSEGSEAIAVTTIADLSQAVVFSRGYISMPAGTSMSMDVRVSLYEGEYEGPYKPYVDQSLITRVSTAETAIEQNAENILLRATKTEAYQVAQPNLSPWFSLQPIENDTEHWNINNGNTTFTPLEDGWVHLHNDNSSGTEAKRTDYQVMGSPSVTPGADYTWLFEYRNNNSTGNNLNYIVQSSERVQFWGNNVVKVLEGKSGGATTTLGPNQDFPPGTDGVYVKRVLKKAEAATSSHLDRTGTLYLGCLVCYAYAGAVADYDLRVSVYEGEYTGPYKPYSGTQLYASQAQLKVANDEIDLRVEKSGVISSINQSAETIKISADKVQIDGTAVFSAIKGQADAAYDAKGAASTVYEKVRSQGIQLVTNGNGFMGDNTNWPALTFDGTKSNGSPGSFTKSVGYADVMADEMFPIDVSKEYLLEFDAMSDGGTGILYSCMCCYDVDGNGILAQNVLYYPNTLTTLAKDLNPGDTTVTLTSATNWANTSADHQRSLVFWDYENSYGYTYPPETYSRNYYSGIYADDGKVNKSTGVITLKSPWTGVKKAKGTYVSQGHSGGTYVYAHANVRVPSEWTHYSAVFSGLDLDKDGIDTAGKFRQGTAFAKVGFLWNYNSHISSQGQIWVTNISVKEATASSSESVKRTQRIYYRSDSATKPATPSAWVIKEDDGTRAWTKMHVAITSTHKYIYTCEQHELANGTVGYTAVLRDNTITVIDGGSIITHSIVADKLDADSVKANIVQTTTILAEQMKTNLLHAMDAVVSDLKAINATIGGFAIDDTSIRSGALNSTASGAVALAKSAFSRAINGTARSLMLAIGSKFGVGADGTLYASGATVDGTVTATAGTIGGASIVDGVLKVKDANVDGKISANHLDVSSIKIGDLSGSIGGRNLLLQTGSMFPRSGTSSGYFIEFTVSNGLLKNSYELDEGVEYTFSADVTSSRDGFQITVGAGSGGFSKDVATKYGLSSGRVSLTFTPTAAQLASGKVFAFRAPRYSTQGTSFTYSVDNVKLEKGSKATDWTPAPEDVDASIATVEQGLGGFDILWNRAEFAADTNAGGECYLCAYDPTTATRSDANGWAMWNGTKRTVAKGAFNPNAVLPYNIPIYIVCRLSSAAATTGTNYMVWYDTANHKWRSGPMSPTASTLADWTWVETTDMILGKFVEPGSEVAFTECETYRQPLKWGSITTDTVTARSANAAAAAAQNTANAAAPKANAVKRTQRIYYRSDSATKPATPSAWVTKEDDGTGAWTKMHVAITSTHKYIYTCEQSEKADGTLGCTAVLRDNTITVIDGGNVITHSIVADKLDADSVKANIVKTTELDATKITSGDIATERMSANIVSAVKAKVSDLYALVAKIGGFVINATSIFSGTAVTSNADNAVALSTADFTRTVNGTSRAGLRFAIGSKFGVEGDGTLYANGANITSINAGNISSGSISADRIKANVISAVNNGTGTINADKVNVSAIKIGDLDGASTVVSNAANGKSAYDRHTAYRGTCSTAAGTAAKVVACTGFALATGATVEVYCSTANTANVPTLNVNSTGAKAVWINGAVASASNPCKWLAGDTVTFTYDGTRFRASLPVEGYVTEGTGGGLMVHRKSDATTGVQITDDVDIVRNGVMVTKLGDDGMTLYDGTVTTGHAIIAQFTKEAVLLGLTASNPTIWLGGRDHALIQEDDGALSLGANSVSLNALNSRASLNTTYITIESSNSENNKKARLSLFHNNTVGEWSGSAAYLDAERAYLNADTFINGTLTLYDTLTLSTPLADAYIDSVSASKLDGTLDSARLPTVPVDKGGTGQTGVEKTTDIAAAMSAASGVTISAAQVATWGKVMQVLITAKATAAKSGTWTVGTMTAGHRPELVTFGTSNLAAIEQCRMGTDGAVSVAGTLAANASVSLTFTYLLA